MDKKSKKKNPPLSVSMSAENLLKLMINHPPIKLKDVVKKKRKK